MLGTATWTQHRDVSTGILRVLRTRPGMYVGDLTDGSGLARMILEAPAFLLSDALPGAPSIVEITLEAAGVVRVGDDRGDIAFPKGRSIEQRLDEVLEHLHTYDAGTMSIGLMNGIAVALALSEWFEIHYVSADEPRSRRYERATRVSNPATTAMDSPAKGVRLAFRPDADVFGDFEVPVDQLRRSLAASQLSVRVDVRDLARHPG